MQRGPPIPSMFFFNCQFCLRKIFCYIHRRLPHWIQELRKAQRGIALSEESTSLTQLTKLQFFISVVVDINHVYKSKSVICVSACGGKGGGVQFRGLPKLFFYRNIVNVAIALILDLVLLTSVNIRDIKLLVMSAKLRKNLFITQLEKFGRLHFVVVFFPFSSLTFVYLLLVFHWMFFLDVFSPPI